MICTKCKKREVYIKKRQLCRLCYDRQRVRKTYKRKTLRLTPLEDIAKELGMSYENVRRIYKSALKKLKQQKETLELAQLYEKDIERNGHIPEVYGSSVTDNSFYHIGL